MTRTSRIIWAAVIVVVILIAVAIILRSRKPAAQKTSTAITHPLNHIQPTYAENGDLASTFPTGLVLGTKPDVTQSYSVPSGDQSQSTAEFDVQETPDTIFQAYIAYFHANSYGIISEQESQSAGSIYASSKGADISVIINSVQNSSSVFVSYLKK